MNKRLKSFGYKLREVIRFWDWDEEFCNDNKVGTGSSIIETLLSWYSEYHSVNLPEMVCGIDYDMSFGAGLPDRLPDYVINIRGIDAHLLSCGKDELMMIRDAIKNTLMIGVNEYVYNTSHTCMEWILLVYFYQKTGSIFHTHIPECKVKDLPSIGINTVINISKKHIINHANRKILS